MRKEVLFLIVLIFCISLFAAIVVADSAATPVSVDSSATVGIRGYISITVGNTIDFGTLNPGEQNQPALNPLNVAIGPETNVPVDVNIQANGDFIGTNPSNHFPIGQMQCSSPNYPLQPISYKYSQICSCLSTNQECDISCELNPPAGQPADLYTAGIVITAAEDTGSCSG